MSLESNHINQAEIVACTSTNAGHQVLYIQSTDENFTIVRIEHKSNLLRTDNQQSKYQVSTPPNGYCTTKPWKQEYTNQIKIVARTSINANLQVSYVPSSDESFTIISIECKSDLLRIYNHTQIKQKPYHKQRKLCHCQCWATHATQSIKFGIYCIQINQIPLRIVIVDERK